MLLDTNAVAVKTPEQLEQERLAALSAHSLREDVALVEMVYRDKWVRFDISTMQAAFLTPAQLVERCFAEPFRVIGLSTLPSEGQLSASTLIVKE